MSFRTATLCTSDSMYKNKVVKQPSQVSRGYNSLIINTSLWNFKHSQGFTKFHTQQMWNLVNLVEGPKFHKETLWIKHLHIGETCEGFFLTLLWFYVNLGAAKSLKHFVIFRASPQQLVRALAKNLGNIKLMLSRFFLPSVVWMTPKGIFAENSNGYCP